MNAEKAESIALKLMTCADAIGAAELLVREICSEPGAHREGDCRDAIDAITGPEAREIASAIRLIAMTLDRSALVKHMEQIGQ